MYHLRLRVGRWGLYTLSYKIVYVETLDTRENKFGLTSLSGRLPTKISSPDWNQNGTVHPGSREDFLTT